MPRKPAYDRDLLIDRARDIFWRKGWAGTSLKDLERALDLRTGSFYAAFGSKDALYELALDRYAEDGVARLRALADKHGALEALRRHPRWIVENCAAAAKACMLSKTLLELHAQNNPLSDHASAHLTRMEALFAELFRLAQYAGEIGTDHDPAQLARRYQSDLLGLRVSAERPNVNASALADDLAADLDRLRP